MIKKKGPKPLEVEEPQHGKHFGDVSQQVKMAYVLVNLYP